LLIFFFSFQLPTIVVSPKKTKIKAFYNIFYLIKIRNIFFNGESIVIGDFGMATYNHDELFGEKIAGTIDYMPPESLKVKQIDCVSDNWYLSFKFNKKKI